MADSISHLDVLDAVRAADGVPAATLLAKLTGRKKIPVIEEPPETPAEREARRAAASAFASTMLRSDPAPYGPPNPLFPVDPATREFQPGIDCEILDRGLWAPRDGWPHA